MAWALLLGETLGKKGVVICVLYLPLLPEFFSICTFTRRTTNINY